MTDVVADTPPDVGGPKPKPLSIDMLAKARLKVAAARQRGFSDSDIDAYLRSEIGAGLADVTRPTLRDMLRTVHNGITLGHTDEMAGAAGTVMGQRYSSTRDALRREQDAFHAVHPKLDLGTQIVAGAIPAAAASLVPGMGPSADAGWLANLLRSSAQAGAMGTVAGEGNSEAPTIGGVAKDAATSGAISAVLGGLMSGTGSAAKAVVHHVVDATHPAIPVARAAARLIPPNAEATIARQEVLAPGTAVAADLTPQTQQFTRFIGADPKAAAAAQAATEQRVSALKATMDGLSAKYEAMNRSLPVDQDLRDILKSAGRSSTLKSDASSVDFAALQRVRTALRAEADASKNSAIRMDKRAAADRLTKWLGGQMSDLDQVDSDWAFLTKRIGAARKTLQRVTSSIANDATNNAAGSTSGSPGGTLALNTEGHVVGRLFERLFGPDKSARARALNELMLTPGDATTTALRKMSAMRAASNAGPNAAAKLARAGLLFDVVPNLSQQGAGLLSP